MSAPRLLDKEIKEQSFGINRGAWTLSSISAVAIVLLLPVIFFALSPRLPQKIQLLGFLTFFALLSIIIVKNSKWLTLGMLVFATSLGLDFSLVYDVGNTFHSSNGYFIHITLFPVFFLSLRMLWLVYQKQQTFSLKDKGLIPLFIFTFICIYSSTVAPEPVYSYYELFSLAQGLLIFLFLSEGINTRNDILVICLAIIGSVALQGIIATGQYVAGSSLGMEFLGASEKISVDTLSEWNVRRASGTLGYPNSLALYFDLTIPVVFALFLSAKRTWTKVLLVGAVFIALLGQVFTISRGGLVATVIALFAIGVSWGIKKRKVGKSTFFFLLIFAIAAVLILATDNPIKERLTQTDDASSKSRAPLMQVAERMIMGNLYTGVGLNAYTDSAPQYDYTFERIAVDFPYPVHNTHLLIIAEIGIFGFLAFMIFIIKILRKSIRMLKYAQDETIGLLAFGLAMGLVAYFIHGLVDFDYVTKNYTFWTMVGCIAGLWQYLIKNYEPLGGITIRRN